VTYLVDEINMICLEVGGSTQAPGVTHLSLMQVLTYILIVVSFLVSVLASVVFKFPFLDSSLGLRVLVLHST
jgi:hypothetical protein